MAQPVVDTLELSKALREGGMEPEQAGGVARALGDQLGEHVAVRGDLELGFERVHAEMALMRTEFEGSMTLMRTDLEGSIKEVRGEMALMRTELEGSITLMRTELDASITSTRAEVASTRKEIRILLAALGIVMSVFVGFGAVDRMERDGPPQEAVVPTQTVGAPQPIPGAGQTP